MRVLSHRFGEIDFPEGQILSVAEGLLGFEDQIEFALYTPEEFRPFAWLLSTNDPDVAFAVADPELFVAEPYELTLSDLDQASLELQEGDSVRVYVIVGPPEAGRPTANLKGPVVVNPRTRRARQLFLYSARLAARQPMLPERSWRSLSTRARTVVRAVTKRAA